MEAVRNIYRERNKIWKTGGRGRKEREFLDEDEDREVDVERNVRMRVRKILHGASIE